jgi:uncharacterized membrane protein YjdF
MNERIRRFEVPIAMALFLAGSVFLLKMAYLKIWYSTPICIAYLWAVRAFVRERFDVRIPLTLLVLVYLSVLLDGLGNLFPLYTSRWRYIQYDEFTHTLIPALTVPIVVWLLQTGLDYSGYRLPFGLVVFLSVTILFTIAGFYEVIELWDDKYLHPQSGMRIHGSYDTANDLQCDLLGMAGGGVVTYWVLKRQGAKQSFTKSHSSSEH